MRERAETQQTHSGVARFIFFAKRMAAFFLLRFHIRKSIMSITNPFPLCTQIQFFMALSLCQFVRFQCNAMSVSVCFLVFLFLFLLILQFYRTYPLCFGAFSMLFVGLSNLKIYCLLEARFECCHLVIRRIHGSCKMYSSPQ